MTQFLRPVREALPVAEMNFNQLLQRDLDDHRVAVELVPYLLNPDRTGPAFFPPVVACLLPFLNRAPLQNFPKAIDTEIVKDFGAWQPTEYGAAFRFDRLLAGQTANEFHASKLGRVNWNPESTELVIIDGQHRAMALLAIDRTINHRWNGSAEKYKSFYEPIVQRCLDGMSAEERQIAFSNVELPVTVIWFPELPERSNQHQAARKVFVDLNKNARPPSPSRLLLLSDTDLISIFTRSLLNDMRSDGAGYPVFAVEYDNPARDQASSAKWSTLTNVANMFESVKRLICGPERFFKDMGSAFVGRDNETQMRLALANSLDLPAAFPETFVDDRTYTRDEIDATTFPPTKVPDLTKQFNDGWGYLMKQFFSELVPFKAHALALRQLRDGWNPNGEPAASLAKDAMFEGVGLYWTLKESEAHWRADNQRLKEEIKPLLPRTDVVNAWDGTQAKKAEFAALRAKAFLKSASKVEESDAAFSIYSTAACQIGFVLAARAVAFANNVEFGAIRNFVDALMSGVNAALDKRELFISRAHTKSLNMLPKLDTPYAVYFRYFWLELFNSKEASAALQAAGFAADVAGLCGRGRWQYREFLIKLLAKMKRSADATLSEQQALAQAKADTDKSLARVLKSLFELQQSGYEQWVKQESLSGTVDEAAMDEELPTPGDDSPASSVQSEIDELERLITQRGSSSESGSSSDTP
ncbi:DNA sulfur modification protein DndB [Paraburkholderia tuberum]|uniref:DNA sulfur modification protein DndB n=1 Tax=Paraburkholderia tuberum TaxID=157910 RepID=UPI001ABCDC59|nr:DNA sulfur modification protein DndB [Paraburkholderia tuberum]